MNVTKTSKRLMENMTPQEIEIALRKAQGLRGGNKSNKNTVHGQGMKKASQDNATAINKNTRPLNSYMAFRSYYSILFSSIQQKEISGFVTYMWQADPFKAKWSLLAKAYSAIRDVQGKANAPLDQFLAMNAPLLGIIEPQQYLKALGWVFILEADGQLMIKRGEPKFDGNALSTGVSVNGVIQHCFAHGYFTGRLSDVLLVNDETAVVISIEGNTNAATDANSDHSNDSNEGVGNDGDANESQDSTEDKSNAAAVETQTSASHDSSIQTEEHPQQSMSTEDAGVATEDASSPGLPIEDNSLQTFEAAQLTTMSPRREALYPSDFMLPSNEFALDEAFDPLYYDDQAVFDPFAGNQFDAFDWMDGFDEYMNADASTS